MKNFKQRIAAEFDQYQLLSTDDDRQAFWSDVEKRTDELTPDQRLVDQAVVRENIEQILRRMEEIVHQLTTKEKA